MDDMKFSDINKNGILDSHEKWFLLVKMIVFLWSLSFLTASYLIKLDVDRTFLAGLFTASAASFGIRKSTK